MTLVNAAWAIDGARVPGSLARMMSYVTSGDAHGVAARNDLKIRALSTPGVGIRMAPGGAVIRNDYQTTPTQSYGVMNEGEEVMPDSKMPAARPSAASHLVVVTIGDPDFSTVGHPWLLATDPPVGEEETFQYVRLHIIENVPASTTTARELNLTYPALEVARLDMPANTTTVTENEIVDLRTLARPRYKEFLEHIGAPDADSLNAPVGQWERFPDAAVLFIDIPEWAVEAKISGFVEGLRLTKNGVGALRVAIQETQAGSEWTQVNDAPATAIDRRTYNVGGKIPIPASLRGTKARFVVQGQILNNVDHQGFLLTDGGTSIMLRLVFEEKPI